MEVAFTWVDALMITSVFAVLGLVKGKIAYDEKHKKDCLHQNHSA